jgi:hypothetical protein
LKRLLLKPDAQAVLAQFARAKIHLKNSKTETPVGLLVFFHDEVKLSPGGVYHQAETTEIRWRSLFPKSSIK